jgi:hypothetical protein
MAAMGYHACHNVAGGFEGPLDDERHRGTVGGWKAAGLAWLQARSDDDRSFPSILKPLHHMSKIRINEALPPTP